MLRPSLRSALVPVLISTIAAAAWAWPGGLAMAQGEGGGAAKPEHQARLWAVLIGIDDQVDPNIPDGKTCVPQAKKMLAWLRNSAGWNRGNVLFLSDGGSNDPGLENAPSANIKPTRKNLDWAFNHWLASKDVLPDDVILVYYAGRSATIAKPSTTAVSGAGKTVLLPADAFLQNAETTGWPLDDAIEPYARRGSFRIVHWLATNPSEFLKDEAQPNEAAANHSRQAGRDWLRRLTRWPGVTAWLAADLRSPANGPLLPTASNDASSSRFTDALINALNAPGRSNLAAALRRLEQDPRLKLQHFRIAGGVSPTLTVRSDRLGRLASPGPPRLILQTGHSGKVNAIVGSSDGKVLVTAGSDATARVWSLDQKALLRVLTGHAVRVSAIAMSPDGNFLVTGGGRGTVLVHDIGRDYLLKPSRPQPHNDDDGPEPSISQIVFLADGIHFVSIDNRGVSYLWNLEAPILAPKPWLSRFEIRDAATVGNADGGFTVVLGNDGSIKRFQADGLFKDELLAAKDAVKGAKPIALAISTDGKRLAIGKEDGKVIVKALNEPGKEAATALKGDIGKLAFAGNNHLLASVETGVVLLRLSNPLGIAGQTALSTEPMTQWAISPDGSSIALALANVGAARAWTIDPNLDAGIPEPVETFRDDQAAVYSLTFAGDSETLVGGGIDVSLKAWDLKGNVNPARPTAWASPINTGKVQQVTTSPNRADLLGRNGNEARLWGLNDRTCRTIPGGWASAVFLSDGSIAMASAADSEQAPGRLAIVDLKTLQADRAFFSDKAEGFSLPENTAFEGLALSDDRSLIAATDSQSPLVCVWETKTGKLLHWTEALDEPARTLGFSSDGKALVSAGGSPSATVWALDPEHAPKPLEKPLAAVRDPSGQTITSLRVRPKTKETVEFVTGHNDGRVLLWKVALQPDKTAAAKPPKPLVLVERFFDGEVKALAFDQGGKNLAAAGDGNAIWLGQLDPKPKRLEGPGARPHHNDQINALEFWPDVPVLVSAGNDGAIRFWDLSTQKLWGTLSMATPATAEPGRAADPEWVLFTPDGLFDASPSGRDWVRYTDRDQSRPLEQFDNTLYTFRLGERLQTASLAKQADPLDAPIPLSIEGPDQNFADEPAVALTFTIGSPKGNGPDSADVLKTIRDLRLYHNGVPIPTGLEDHDGPPPRQFSAKVNLVEKINRFYLMASRPGAADSRSPDLDVVYNGKLEQGRVHVVAIGVGDYQRLRLTYATSDAGAISKVLYERGKDAEGRKGALRLLTDTEVNRDSIVDTFSDIARRTKNRPQDTVVVFLAGHTGVFDNDRFCLLLPTFPFPKAEPTRIAMRGATTEVAPGVKLTPEHTLPYTHIVKNLMRLDALNRLVIVDACQAEAILADPQVIEINKWMEIGSRRARTSYLLAARRGDPALEFDPLRHGLFTFTLLRGMGALPDDECPEEIAKLTLPLNADANADGKLTTNELRGFVDNAMPKIAELFPKLVAAKRSAVLPGTPTPSPPLADDSEQFLKLQRATQVSFPLIPLR